LPDCYLLFCNKPKNETLTQTTILTNEAGELLSLTYDLNKRVIKSVGKETFVYEYFPDKIVVKLESGTLNKTKTYNLDRGFISDATDYNGEKQFFNYNQDGYLTKIINNYTYDLLYTNGNLTTVTKSTDGFSEKTNISYLNDEAKGILSRLSIKQITNSYDKWKLRKSPTDHNWYDIVWAPELSLFVAIATDQGSMVMTSSDGINWNTHPAASDNSWISVSWSPFLKLFVAVASSGNGDRVMTSPNGINWTSRRSASDNSWRAIEWSPDLKLFAAVSTSGNADRIMTSPDGIVWTTRLSPNNAWRAIEWSSELKIFVALASTGVGNRVMTSKDGINWIPGTTPNDSDWFGVQWSPHLKRFSAVADGGTDKRSMTSSDGINWVQTDCPTENWHDLVWAEEIKLFAAVSYSGIKRVMTSYDGQTWTSTHTPTDNLWMALAWSPKLNMFASIAKTGTGNRIMTGEIGDRFYDSFEPDLVLFNEEYFGKTSKNVVKSHSGDGFTASYTYEKDLNDVVIYRDEIINGRQRQVRFR
jgi:hypothetical protein